MGVERLFFSQATSRRRSGSARRAASSCWRRPSTACPSARRPRARSRARSPATARPTRSRSPRMVQLVLGHERAAATRRRRRRAGHRGLGRQHGAAGGQTAHGRRSWTGPPIAPIDRGETGYERAVREALAADERDAPTSATRPDAVTGRDRVGRGRRRGGRVRFARHRGRRDRLSRVRGAGRSSPRPSPAVGSSSTPTTSSARTSRRCTGSGRPRSSGSSRCC